MTTEPETTASKKRVKKPRAWLAGLLSLLCPGLGQLYCGRPRRAVWQFVFVAALYLVIFLIGRPALTYGAALAIAALGLGIVVATIAFAIDAVLTARNVGTIALGRYQRAWIYMGVWLLGAIVSNLGVAALETMDCPKVGDCMPGFVFSTPSGSMEPTLMIGDLFFTDSRYYLHHEPRRGDVAVFRYPHDTTIDYVKRIAGVPGDRIAFKDGRLIINGTVVERQPVGKFDYTPDPGMAIPVWLDQYVETLPDGPNYQVLLQREPGPLETTSEVIVPPDHYFVVGDNRDYSNDSRRLEDVGFLPRQNLTARPKFIYWSRSWSRIGMAIQ